MTTETLRAELAVSCPACRAVSGVSCEAQNPKRAHGSCEARVDKAAAHGGAGAAPSPDVPVPHRRNVLEPPWV
ncbi:MAG: hypothetical protein JWL64_1798 [Frankiales bacterium]|nr:hypothetical protein [Frankiales bacterium]